MEAPEQVQSADQLQMDEVPINDTPVDSVTSGTVETVVSQEVPNQVIEPASTEPDATQASEETRESVATQKESNVTDSVPSSAHEPDATHGDETFVNDVTHMETSIGAENEKPLSESAEPKNQGEQTIQNGLAEGFVSSENDQADAAVEVIPESKPPRPPVPRPLTPKSPRKTIGQSDQKQMTNSLDRPRQRGEEHNSVARTTGLKGIRSSVRKAFGTFRRKMNTKKRSASVDKSEISEPRSPPRYGADKAIDHSEDPMDVQSLQSNGSIYDTEDNHFPPAPNEQETIVPEDHQTVHRAAPRTKPIGQTENSEVTLKNRHSMDRVPDRSVPSTGPASVRRAQTLRTPDYAARLRERVLSYQEASADDATVKTPRNRPVTHVQTHTETYKWPGNMFKLKRKSQPPKYVRAEVDPPVHRPVAPNRPTSKGIGPSVVEVDYHKQTQVTQPERQLTSLRSLANASSGKQSTRISDSGSRGLISGLLTHSELAHNSDLSHTKLPYMSSELDPTAHSEQSDKMAEVNETDLEKNISPAVLKMHHFLLDWHIEQEHSVDESEQETSVFKFQPQKSIKFLSDYLSTCMRLQSVDLQGRFAPFHYPLLGFSGSLWKRCAILTEWNDLAIIREPNWNTEYVQLKSFSGEYRKAWCQHIPFDTMLTNWLDSRKACGLPGGHHDVDKDMTVYHPVLLASRLDQCLKLSSADMPFNVQVWDLCLRLNVLLAYQCYTEYAESESDTEPFDVSPENCLLFMSTSNCLSVFFESNANDVVKNNIDKNLIHSETAPTPEPQPQMEEHTPEENNVAKETVVVEEQKNEDGLERDERDTNHHTTESGESFVKLDAELESMPVVDALNGIDGSEEVKKIPIPSIVQLLSPNSNNTVQAVDDLIDKIYELSMKAISLPENVCSLIEAVGPPDWVALTLARICLKKH